MVEVYNAAGLVTSQSACTPFAETLTMQVLGY